MGGWVKYWTEQERNDLLKHYFDGSLAQCPLCSIPLAFRMNHTSEVVALSVRCENCRNMAVLLFSGLVGLPAEPVSQQI
ncbi:MAG TPA: hypothetical protein VFE51_00415 [Verrucomicrobiae bacterium]|nr:hypothetical protein [Verrucomicrobiae bacterium]